MGAHVIVNHHQHSFSGYEIYNGYPIFFGLGNFFFDRLGCRNAKWNQDLLLQLESLKDKTNFCLIQYEQCNYEVAVEIRDYDFVKSEIKRLNAIIADDEQLEQELEKMVTTAMPLYPFLPFGNKEIRSLYFRGWLKNIISKKNKALMENHVSCETHREILLKHLKSTK